MIMPIRIVAAFAILTGSVGVAARASPWFGIWKLRDAGKTPETLIYSDAGGGAMRMESVEERSVLVTRFDGKPARDIGARKREGRTLAIKALSPTSYRWTFSVSGKPLAKGINTLAPDRRTFVENSWSMRTPNKRVTLTYERR